MSESIETVKAKAAAAAEQVPSVLMSVRRRMRTLIAVQLVVAAGALGAAAWGFYSLQQYEQRKEKLQEEIGAAASRLENADAQLKVATAQLEEKAAEVDGLERRRQELAQEIGKQRQSLLFIENAVTSIERKDYPAAIDALLQAEEAAPGSATVWRLLSQSYAETDQFQQAIEARQTAIQANREQNPDKIYASKENPYAFVDTTDDIAWLAIYQCGAGEYAAARRTLEGASSLVMQDLQTDQKDLAGKLLAACADAPSAVAPQLAAEDGANAPSPGQIEQRAQERAEAYQINEVYLHVASKADQDAAEKVKEALEAAGYQNVWVDVVAEVKGYQRSIRYYHAEQAQQADEMAGEICAAMAGGGGLTPCADSPLEVLSLAGKYKNLPRDRVEVWL